MKSKDDIEFSSDSSLQSDNSFNSNEQEDINDDYRNTFFNLQEQMNQLFIDNPELRENILFEALDFEEEEEERRIEEEKMKNKTTIQGTAIPKQKYITDNEKKQQLMQLKDQEKRDKSKLWGSITHNILRNAPSKIPSHLFVFERLNLYKKESDNIDYVDLLLQEKGAKKYPKQNGFDNTNKDEDRSKNDGEKQDEQIGQINNDNVLSPKKSTKNGKSNNNNNDNLNSDSMSNSLSLHPTDSNGIEYFSFKKRIESQAKKQYEKKYAKAKTGPFDNSNSYTLQEISKLNKIQATSDGIKNNLGARGSVKFSTNETQQSLNGQTNKVSFQRNNLSGSVPSLNNQPAQVSSQGNVGNINVTGNNIGESAIRKSVFMRLGASRQSRANFSEEILAKFSKKKENLEFYTTKIGKQLFSLMQQSKGDKDAFRKAAQEILRDYYKDKEEIFKPNKKTIGSIPKFTQPDNLFLNSLIPEVNSSSVVSMRSLETNAAYFKPSLATHPNEAQFLSFLDILMNSDMLKVKKNQLFA